MSVSAPGFARKDDLPLVAGTPHEITLTPPTTIRGTVVDGQTGQSIPQFSLLFGTVWSPEGHLIWQRGYGTDRQAKKQPGTFEYALHQPAHQYLMRVSAEAYLPEDSGLFLADHGVHDFTFRLTRADPIKGTFQKLDGSPAPDTMVYLVPADDELHVQNGDVLNGQHAIRAKAGPDGQFVLPPQKENYLLAAFGDAGFAVAFRRDLRGGDIIRLEPWARVTGTVRIDGKPAANLLLSSNNDEPSPVAGEPHLRDLVHVKTDANGRFEILKLNPGRHILGEWVPNGAERRSWFVNLATLDAVSGKTYTLNIGERGRRVTGRLAIPPGSEPMVRKASIEPARATLQSPPIGVHVFADGSFRAQDLPSGAYVLRIALHEPPPENACGWGRLIGAYSHEFAVTGTAEDTPLDLGVLQPAQLASRSLKIGDSTRSSQ